MVETREFRSPVGDRLPLALPQLTVTEMPIGSLVQVAAWPGGGQALDTALARENVPAMPKPLASSTRGAVTIMNVAPDRALVLAERGDLYTVLAASVPADEGTVTDLSHARVLLRVAGERARWVLSKGVAIDLHADAFPVGHTVATEIAHIGVIVRRADEDTYDLMPYRGFAVSLVEWLEAAGAQDGRAAA